MVPDATLGEFLLSPVDGDYGTAIVTIVQIGNITIIAPQK